MSRNEVLLSGRVTHLEPLRYTPAGIPLLSFSLLHASQQMEAQHERTVHLDQPVVVIGELAREMAALTQDQPVLVKGFLARRSVKSALVVLHATAYKTDLE